MVKNMAKTYIDTVKYLVYASLDIGGLVEKPDVVGAVFGQTEGLLGDELDLRELQKNGRIGRIEVDLQARGGRSIGKITLPSSLDMVETSILAAALETVDRIGPCDAKIIVEKVEDTRNAKRKQIVDRAKNLLKNLLTTEIPESKEISELVRQEVKVAEITEYGSEKLPCGPQMMSSEALVVVEGRADVLNLLKNGINNAIAIGGANVPKTLANLCRQKETTVFLDGDRGGDIILRELSEVCDIDFVARAPRGKEVEELTRKEIIKCMRARVPAEQVEGVQKRKEQEERAEQQRVGYPEKRERTQPAPYRQPSNFQRIMGDEPAQQPTHLAVPSPSEVQAALEAPSVPESLKASFSELENTLRARIYDETLSLKGEIPVRDLIKSLQEGGQAHAVVLDGIVTQRLIDLADQKGVKILVGVKQGNILKRPAGMAISTKA